MTGVRTGSIVAAMALAMLALPARAGAAEHALILDIDGAIGPPTADYVVSALAAAKPDEVGLVILRMNTPGGLDTSMREIIKAILASPIPVATYVAPNGARAASAGTYIAYASAIAAMAPSTNIGAATPVQLGGDQPLAPEPNAKAGTIAAGQRRRAGKCHGPQDGQRRRRLYPRARRAQRPQRRVGRRGGALGRQPSRRRGAGAARDRRDRRRHSRSAAPDRRTHGDGRGKAAAPGDRRPRNRSPRRRAGAPSSSRSSPIPTSPSSSC